MKNKIKLLSTLLFAGAFAMNISQSAQAAVGDVLTATQPVTATLDVFRKVSVDPAGVTTSTIAPLDGQLESQLTPQFFIETNQKNLNIYLRATCDASDNANYPALRGDGGDLTTFIALTHTTEKPDSLSVDNALGGASAPGSNINVIAYPVNKPTTTGGFVYNWVTEGGFDQWKGQWPNRGKTDTQFKIPAGAAKGNTYSYDDETGTYKATIIISFLNNTTS